MNIRDAVQSDVNTLAELLLSVHQLHVDAHPEIYREISHDVALDVLIPRLADGNTSLRVAETNHELVGYSCASVRPMADSPLFQQRTVLYVNEIVVARDRRRERVGHVLIADIRNLARQNNVDEIELDVGQFNRGARQFFEKQGFSVRRTRMGLSDMKTPPGSQA